MEVDKTANYFFMSFRFDKCKPEDYGLARYDNDIFILSSDKSLWVKRDLYDFGWGKECGFMRLPKLNFNNLLDLLFNSEIQSNRYGAAVILEEDYPDDLLDILMNLFNTQNPKINNQMKKAFEILQLERPRNRCNIIDKQHDQIQKEYENWRFISEKVFEILKENKNIIK